MVFWALISLLGVSAEPASHALPHKHPFHVSVAELEYNKDSKCLEVALKVWPEDLEKALSQVNKAPVDLDKHPKIDDLIASYLKRNIHVSPDGKTNCKINWVGKEIEVRHAWLYFEIKTEKEPDNFHFGNTIFFELQDDQINIFNLKLKDRRASISFAKDKASKQLTQKDFIPVRNPFSERK